MPAERDDFVPAIADAGLAQMPIANVATRTEKIRIVFDPACSLRNDAVFTNRVPERCPCSLSSLLLSAPTSLSVVPRTLAVLSTFTKEERGARVESHARRKAEVMASGTRGASQEDGPHREEEGVVRATPNAVADSSVNTNMGHASS